MLERLKTKATKVFYFFFYADIMISNFNEWTAKQLRQASWTELALTTGIKKQKYWFLIGDAHRPAGCPGIDMPVSEWQYIAEDTSTQSDVMQCEKSNYAPEGKNLWIRGRLQRQLWKQSTIFPCFIMYWCSVMVETYCRNLRILSFLIRIHWGIYAYSFIKILKPALPVLMK